MKARLFKVRVGVSKHRGWLFAIASTVDYNRNISIHTEVYHPVPVLSWAMHARARSLSKMGDGSNKIPI